MECHLGRKLKKEELLHHINHNHLDNRIENLQVVTRREHFIIHKVGHKTRFKDRYNLQKSKLIELSKTKTYREMTEMFKCSIGAIQQVIGKKKSKVMQVGKRRYKYKKRVSKCQTI